MKTTSLLSAILLAGSLCGAAASAQTISGPALLDPGPGLVRMDTADPLNVPHRFSLVIPADIPRPPQREALVEVRVDLDEAGAVDKVRVIDGFHDAAIARLVEDAVEQASFSPATAGGAPVAFENLELQILQRGAYPPGVTDSMREELVKLGGQLQEEDYKGAERSIEGLLERQSVRLFEMALLKDQLATVYMETERMPEALVAIRQASGRSPAVIAAPGSPDASPDATWPDSFLPPELYVEALRKHVMISLLTNQIGEAQQAFALLGEAAGPAGHPEVVTALQPQMDKVNALVASEEPVGSVIRLVDEEWVYTMSPRRIFGVTRLEGQVDAIDVACGDNPVRRLPFQNDSEWQIPASWGQCDLVFRGKDDTTFVLYEYLN